MRLPTFVVLVILPVLSLALLLTFARLLLGPSLPDRVIALDMTATLSIAVVAVYALATGQPALLDVAIVLALLVFLGTVGFAYYIERRGKLEVGEE
ncbi:MAG: cation:proton antiporter [Candidatus Electrothrix sp. AX2]|nr:cation:proton antiporter [Candidatus Electrothrix gigas]